MARSFGEQPEGIARKRTGLKSPPQVDQDAPQTLPQGLGPFRAVVGVLRAPHRLDCLVQEDVVRAAETAAALLQSLADGVHGEVSADLLVDHSADEPARDAASGFGRQKLGVRELREFLLQVWLAACDDVGQFVVDEQEDERDRLDGLSEEEAEGGERSLLGGVGGGIVASSARVGDVREEVLLAGG